MNPKQETRLLILEHIQTQYPTQLTLVAEYPLNAIFTPLELRGHAQRKGWVFDFAIREIDLVFEYEGIFAARKGQSGKSRHLTVGGYSDDCEKYSYISGILGWRLVRITPIMVSDGRAGPLIRDSIDAAVRQSSRL